MGLPTAGCTLRQHRVNERPRMTQQHTGTPFGHMLPRRSLAARLRCGACERPRVRSNVNETTDIKINTRVLEEIRWRCARSEDLSKDFDLKSTFFGTILINV